MSYLELAVKVLKKEQKPQPVPFETLDAIFQAAIARIDAWWVKDPGLQNRYDGETANGLMGSIDQLWRDCLAGRARVEDFRQAVDTWTNVCGKEAISS